MCNILFINIMQGIYKVILILAILSSCIKREKHEGIILEDEDVQKIQLGLTQTQVIEVLGTPSIKLIDIKNMPETWIYVSIKKSWILFLMPDTDLQKVLELEFKNNKVSKIINKVYEGIKYQKQDIKIDIEEVARPN